MVQLKFQDGCVIIQKDLLIDVIHGHDFPDNLSDYRLIVHCGGCMLTRRAMQTRINEAKLMDVPIVNYGVLISYMHGAIPRALLPFEEAIAEWEKLREIVFFHYEFISESYVLLKMLKQVQYKQKYFLTTI